MDRESENEKRNQDLRDEIELKNKKIENLLNKIKTHDDQVKQFVFALEQEKHAYSELLKTSEEHRSTGSAEMVKLVQFEGDEVRELQERLEKSKQQNEDLRCDFTKTADDYEKSRHKEIREVEKLKAHSEKFKGLCEKKDVELKRLRALTKEPMKNEQLLKGLRQKLMKSDEKCVAMELKNEDLENKVEVEKKKYQSEMVALNKKLNSLIEDNDQLQRKLNKTLEEMSLLEKENIKLKQQLVSHPLTRTSMISPLTRSLSTLKVISSEQGQDSTAGEEKEENNSVSLGVNIPKDELLRRLNMPKGNFKTETPKRNNDSAGIYFYVYFASFI